MGSLWFVSVWVRLGLPWLGFGLLGFGFRVVSVRAALANSGESERPLNKHRHRRYKCPGVAPNAHNPRLSNKSAGFERAKSNCRGRAGAHSANISKT